MPRGRAWGSRRGSSCGGCWGRWFSSTRRSFCWRSRITAAVASMLPVSSNQGSRFCTSHRVAEISRVLKRFSQSSGLTSSRCLFPFRSLEPRARRCGLLMEQNMAKCLWIIISFTARTVAFSFASFRRIFCNLVWLV